MQRRDVLKAAAWTTPVLASQKAGVAWAAHYARPPQGNPPEPDEEFVSDPCEAFFSPEECEEMSRNG